MTHWISLLEVAQVTKGLHYQDARVPFSVRLPGDFEDGQKVFVQGVPKISAGKFTINLQSGSDDSSDIQFHFDVRFEHNAIVFNSRRDGSWGEEIEKEKSFIVVDKPFLFELTATGDGYDVSINNEYLGTLPYRMSAKDSTHLVIFGDLRLPGVHLPMPKIKDSKRISIPGNILPTSTFILNGTILDEESGNFSINFQCGESDDSDIIFHFNPRFASGTVVRNSRESGAWGEEEVDGTFPFNSNHLSMSIIARNESYHIWINGEKFASFKHRMDMKKACVLNIEGGVEMDDVSIDCPPGSLPAGSGFEEIIFQSEWKEDKYNPQVPVVMNLPDFEAGCVVCLSGVVNPEADRFRVNLQISEEADGNVALHYNPRMDANQVVLNSREDGNWNSEIRWDDFPFSERARFELIIYCADDAFYISLNNESPQKFDHRMDYRQVNTLLIDGDVSIKRVIYCK